MQVGVLHVGGADACFFKRQPNCAGGLLWTFQPHTMERLACRTVPGDLRIDFRATLASMIQFFEHEHPRSLTEHKPVAIRRERTRALFRCMVPRTGENSH